MEEQGGVSSGNFDSTIEILKEGVTQVAIDRAMRDIEGWQRRLQAADDRGLTPIVDNLDALRTELMRDTLDGVTIGGLLSTLSDQVRRVASEGTEGGNVEQVTDKLEDLSRLLDAEGRSVSGA